MTDERRESILGDRQDRISYGPSALGEKILVTGEEIQVESRPLVWMHMFEPVMGTLTMIGILVAIKYFESRYPDFQYWNVVAWAGIALVLLAAISVLTTWLRWRFTVYALTNKRVLRRTGVFGRSYLDCSLGKIQNVEVNVPALGRIFGFGTIRIATARTKGEDIDWSDIKDPMRVQGLINEALDSHGKAE